MRLHMALEVKVAVEAFPTEGACVILVLAFSNMFIIRLASYEHFLTERAATMECGCHQVLWIVLL